MNFLHIKQCVDSVNRMTVLLNDLAASNGYINMNPLKSEVADIRLSQDEMFVEVIMINTKNQLLCATPIFFANVGTLMPQNIIPVDKISEIDITTNAQLCSELIKLL